MANIADENVSPRVSIYSVDSSGVPDSELYLLSGTVSEGEVTLTAPANAVLAANTEYYVYFEDTDTSEPRGSYAIGLVTDADTDTALSGWQMGVRRSRNGNGDWSDGGARSAAIEVAGSIVNNAPVFSDAALARTVAANKPAGENVGAAIPAATDADNDTLVYSLEGADAASFEFDAASRQIGTRTGVTYGRKGKNNYSVTVKADDGWGGTDTVAVTVTATNMQELAPRAVPPKMDAPTVHPTSGSHTSLTVSWTAPDNVQPLISHYDVNYRRPDLGGVTWTRGNHDVEGTSTTLTGLRADRPYRVRLRAVNADGNGGWIASQPQEGVFTNNPPLHVPATWEVPADWPLKPAALEVGDKFRLLFVTGERYGLALRDLDFVGTTVRDEAAGGHSNIQRHASSFTPIACSYNSNAIVNTGTPTSDSSVSVYWLGGEKVADDYADLYDGDWDSNEPRLPDGNTAPTSGDGGRVAHGCQSSGRSHNDRYVGEDRIMAGQPGSSGSEIEDAHFGLLSATFRMYGLSGIFTVGTNTPPTASDSSVTTDEDAPYTFATANFNFADTDTGNTLSSVKVVTLPTAGALALDDTAVTEAQVVPHAEIGDLVFTPAANANGTDYASFTFKVSDGTHESASAYTMTVNVTAVNDPATGAPSISGTAQVGETLTASTSGIEDVDGLTGVSYTYQWVQVDADGISNATDIASATSGTYTPVAADVGKKLKVQVSFTDNEGNDEERTSDAWPSSETIIDPALGICGRTAVVRTALLDKISGVTDCALVTDTHLAAISGTLGLKNMGITSLAAGDFDGLTALGHLHLFKNEFTTLPAGMFKELSSLTYLDLHQCRLDTLPAGVFRGLTELVDLRLDGNLLRMLPDGIFEPLTSLRGLVLSGNPGQSSFVPEAVALPDDARVPATGGYVTLDGSGSSGGPWGTNVTYSWALPSSTFGATVRFPDNDSTSVSPRVRIISPTVDTVLTFTLTVSGRGGQDSRRPNDTDTATVTVTVNSAATGLPTISGTAQVGETLTASTSGIADVDGLTNVSYTYQWVRVASGTDTDISGATSSTYTLADADEGNTVKVEVSFTDDAGNSEGPLISAATGVVAANTAPEFPDATLTREVAENTMADVNVGDVIPAAADADTGAILEYSMEGADAASFNFDVSTRQISTKSGVTYNFEATKNSYSATIKVDDSNGGTDTVAVTINVTDVDEPPDAPPAPSAEATSGSNTSLDVSWTAPGNDGKPGIVDYDLQYRVAGTEDWIAGPQNVETTSAVIADLTASTDYQVQVRARNVEGDGDWSASGVGATSTPGNNPPDFSDTRLTREIAENTGADVNVGDVIPEATDADTGATLVYSMEGADMASFNFNVTTRQITTKANVTYNFEDDPSYSVRIKVSDGTDSDRVAVTINLTDVDEPPSAPTGVGVTPTLGAGGSLDVVWTAPGNDGKPMVIDYDLQYGTSDTGPWSNGPQGASGTSSTISGLAGNTLYYVRVRARNAEGDGTWSSTGSARTRTATNSMNCAVPNLTGRTQIWSAAVSVGKGKVNNIVTLVGYNTVTPHDVFGALSDTSVEIGTNIYTVQSLAVVPVNDSVWFGVNNFLQDTETAELKLHICDDDFAFSSSSKDTNFGFKAYQWTLTSPDWLTYATRNVYLSVPSTNTAPSAADKTVTLAEDGTHTFEASDFNFSDSDGDALASVRVVTLPGLGALALDGSAVSANDVVAAADIDELVFTPAADGNGTGYASFTFKVSDGLAESTPAVTLTLDVTAVADAPVVAVALADQSATVTRAFTYVVPADAFTDADGDTLLYSAARSDDSALPTWLTFTAATRTFAGTPGTVDIGAVTLKVTVKDGDGDTARSVSDEFALVVSTNTAPSAADKTVTLAEDGTHTFEASDFNFSDSDGDALASVRVVTLPGLGALALDGSAVSANDVVAAADIDELVFTPAADGNGTGYASFTFKVSDGLAESTPAVTLTLDVTAVADAPVVAVALADQSATVTRAFTYVVPADAFTDADGDTLLYSAARSDDSALPTWLTFTAATRTFAGTPGTVDIGAVTLKVTVKDGDGDTARSVSDEFALVVSTNTAPSAADKTVTLAEDGTHTFEASDFNFSDSDGDALASVRVVTLPGLGALALDGSAVSANDVVAAADIDELVFTPAADGNGTGYASFTFKVSDGLAESTPAVTLTLDVTAVADAPVVAVALADQSATVTRAFTYVVPADAFTDADGDTLLYSAARSDDSALPTWLTFTAATRTFAGTPGTVDIGAVTLKVTVKDGDGDTARSVSDEFALVVSTNTAPSAADKTVTLAEDGTHTFEASDFNFSDSDGDALASVRVVTLPGLGALALDGSAVSANDVVAAADIDELVFTPAADGNGTGYASFTFKVSDGLAESTPAVTLTLDVTAVADAPVVAVALADQSATVTRAFTYVVPADAFTDADGDTLLYSAARSDDSALPTWLTFTAATRTFAGTPGTVDIGAVTLKVTVKDGDGDTARSVSDEFALVVSTNTAPSAADKTVTLAEDGTHTFEASDFNFSDSDGDALASVRVVTLPGLGALALDGSAVSANDVVAAADIDELVFTPAADGNGTGYASFTFKVSDGLAESTPAVTLTLDVTAVADAPVVAVALADQSATVTRAFTYVVPADAFTDADGDTLLYSAARSDDSALPTWLTFTAATRTFAGTPGTVDIGAVTLKVTVKDGDGDTARSVSDEFALVVSTNTAPSAADKTVTLAEDGTHTFEASDFNFSDSDGDALASVRVVTLPGLGALALDGSAVSANDVVAAADIDELVFTPAADGNGTGYASFTFKVSDGLAESTPAVTLTLDVTAVADAPVVAVALADQSATVTRAFTYVVPADAFTDADGDTLLYSAARSDDSALPTWLTFTAATRTFAGTPGTVDIGAVTLKVTVKDGDGDTARSVSDEFALVVSTNTAPSAADKTVTLAEDGTHTFEASDFNFSDSDGDALASVRVVTLPGLGALALDGSAVSANDVVAAADIDELVFTPAADGNGTGYASFTFKVSDGLAESTPAVTLTLDVTAVADAPVVAVALADQSATVTRAFTYVVPADAFTDADGDTLLYSAARSDDSALPTWLTFTAATRTFAGTPGTVDIGAVTLKVTVKDGDGDTARSVSDEFALVVSTNTAPTFAREMVTRSVAENSPADVNVGEPIPAATDVDTGDPLTYSMKGADEASFNFDPSTRQITTKAGVDYDYENTPSYTVTVKVDDGRGGTDTVAVTINLTDVVNEVILATLDGLSLSGIELIDSFAANQTGYTATVPHAVTRTTVTVELTSEDATATILPVDAASEAGHQVDLGVGVTTITVRVTTPIGDEETYRVTVTREQPRPKAPVGFGGSGDAGTVTLDWQTPADGGSPVLRYEYRYRSVGGTWPSSWTLVPGGASARRLEVTGLEVTGRYEFELRAVGGNGPGPASSAVVEGSASYGTLTAAFEEHPDPLVHFGEAFRVTLKFWQLVRGERPEIIARSVRVSGGTARHAKPRHYRPQHVHLEVTPSGSGDVEVVLEPLPCEVEGSICTSWGNGLAGRQKLSIRGVAGTPGVPANVRGHRRDNGYAMLTWDSNEEATAFTLRWRRSGAEEWREESGRPPVPDAEPFEAFGPLERGRSYDVELRWESPRGAGAWLDVSDAVRNLVPPRPQSLTLTQRGPSAVALDWRPGAVAGSMTIAKHQVRLARHPQNLPGGVDLHYATIRVFRDDGWVDIPDSGHNGANFGGALLSGTFRGRPLLHVWELRAQVRAVSGAGAVSQASEVAFVADTAPEFAGIELRSRPAHGTAYAAGETIAMDLVVSEPVTVTGGTPALAMRIGSENREAAFTRLYHPDWAYEGGWVANSGTRMRFEYVVTADDATDEATGGIEIPGGEVRLNGATVRDGTLLEAGAARKRAVLSWAAATVLDNSAVGAVLPERVTGARLVTGPGENGTWDVREPVTAEVTFSAAVMVQGFPTLGVTLDGVRREAGYALGSGTATVRFSYPVTAEDAGATRARLVANGFDVTNGVIGGTDGRPAELGFAVAPWVTAVAVLPDASGDGRWTTGEKIEAQLTFSEAVTVTDGTPSVRVTAGDAAKRAPYASGAGTESLVFAYPVTEAGGTVTAVALTADSLALNGAAVSASASGLAAELGHDGAESAAVSPRPAVLPALSVADAQATEGAGAVLSFVVTLAPAATDTVTVHWATANGTATAGSDYTAGSGTLTFAPGETAKTVTVAVVDDTTVETGSGETVTLGLSNASGATLGDAAATGTIADDDTAPVTSDGALTAQLTDVPLAHAGPFTFLVSFSEALATGAGRLAAASFAATDATVTGVRHVGGGSNLWEVSVRPQPGEDALVTLASGRACDAAGAVCAEGGATLSNSVSATVPSAPMLSISDARAVEGEDASMTFTVTLAPASSGTVTVDYATGGGSATEGEDYTGVHGRLRFAPGETSKTIEVEVFDDEHDEGEEIFHLVLYLADGAYIADGAGRGTIVNSDAMPRAWLSRFGRTVAEQVIEVVGARLRTAPRAGVEATLAGQALPRSNADGTDADGTDAGAKDAAVRAKAAREAEAQERLATFSDWLRGGREDGKRPGLGVRVVTERDLLTGTSFALTAAAGGRGGLVSFWGRSTVSRFDGREDDLSLDGEVVSAMLGTDWTREAWTAGLLLSHSRGEGGYRGAGEGTVTSSVTGLYPYGRYMVNPRVTLWGVAGYGAGTLTLTPKNPETGGKDSPIRTDMDLMMAATGVRGVAVEAPADGGFELAATSDAMMVRSSSEKTAGLEAADAGVTRLRLGLEGIRRGIALGGGELTPRLGVGVRHDGGDAETGFGLDLGGGLAWSHGQRGLSVDLSGRGLLTHESRGFRDRGLSGSLAWDPGQGSGRGPKLTLTQTMGASASGGMDALLGRENLVGLAANDNPGSAGGDDLQNRRLELRLGYGFPGFGERFTSTPELGLELSNGYREYSLGWRLDMAGGGANSLELYLEATRRESANEDDDPEHAVGLRLTARF